VHAVVRPVGGSFSAPAPLAAGLAPAVDLSINGTAFASFTSGGDVRLARLDRRTNTWEVLAQLADADPARAAGHGANRSRVAISADGIGIVTWGEAGHVYARKMFNTRISASPQDLTPTDFEGRSPLLSDLPDIDSEDDSSYAWVVFRQSFTAGGSRILARRQRGTSFDPAVAVDAGDESVGEPRIELTGRGVGLTVTTGAGTHQPMAALVDDDVFAAGARLFSPSVAGPAVGTGFSENNDGLVAAVVGGHGELPSVRARRYEDRKPGEEIVVSRPELGPVDPTRGFAVSSDRASGAVIAWVQGGSGDRRIVAGLLDREPGRFVGYSSQKCCQGPLPRLTWQPSFEIWGPLRYQVAIDGKVVAETAKSSLKLTTPIAGGTHSWQVTAIDVRGQSRRSRRRLLRVDDVAPRMSIGYRRAKRVVTLHVVSRERKTRGQRASGLRATQITWGDASRRARGTHNFRVTHRYPGNGSYELQIKSVDKAGNETISRRTVRIGAT
jgi:hypothetical protein